MQRQTVDLPADFVGFGLHHKLLQGVAAAGFKSARPIQLDTVPAGLEGRDVLGLARTGTGKTAAFALPLLHRMLSNPGPGPRALILAPTRELATQIAEEFRTLARFTRLRLVTVYGGVSTQRQISALRGRPEIVVGCPGRVLDLIGQGRLHLDRTEALVLDEADHMFDMGFLRDIRKIIAVLPKRRQNLLFSATMPAELRRLADGLLRDPLVVETENIAPAETIDHALYPVAPGRKRAMLERMLQSEECKTAIVFTRTKHRAKRLALELSRGGHNAVGLQGNMSQSQRDRAMGGFRSRRFDILVATDIAARGIDVEGVSHVINFDVPSTPEAYTHRIGRTGRSERSGMACTLVTEEDRQWIRATERKLGAAIPRRHLADFDAGAVHLPAHEPSRPGRSGGGRRQRSRRRR
jgi:ATP-dependent RNA helicase RhlE